MSAMTISKSYIVLLGLEGYTRTKKKLAGVRKGMKNVFIGKEAKEATAMTGEELVLVKSKGNQEADQEVTKRTKKKGKGKEGEKKNGEVVDTE